MDVTLGHPGTPKVMVCSHERSGTHFLMNTLADNFGYVSDPWIDVDWHTVFNPYMPANFITALFQQVEGKPVLNTFKNHFPAEFLTSIMNYLLTHFKLFYIYREPGPTMESFARHVHGYDWPIGPVATTGADFAGMAPEGAALRYQMKQFRTMADRHIDHVASWMVRLPIGYRSLIHYVPFERLRDDFEGTLQGIARFLGMEPPRKAIMPSKYERVMTPPEVIYEAA